MRQRSILGLRCSHFWQWVHLKVRVVLCSSSQVLNSSCLFFEHSENWWSLWAQIMLFLWKNCGSFTVQWSFKSMFPLSTIPFDETAIRQWPDSKMITFCSKLALNTLYQNFKNADPHFWPTRMSQLSFELVWRVEHGFWKFWPKFKSTKWQGKKTRP